MRGPQYRDHVNKHREVAHGERGFGRGAQKLRGKRYAAHDLSLIDQNPGPWQRAKSPGHRRDSEPMLSAWIVKRTAGGCDRPPEGRRFQGVARLLPHTGIAKCVFTWI